MRTLTGCEVEVRRSATKSGLVLLAVNDEVWSLTRHDAAALAAMLAAEAGAVVFTPEQWQRLAAVLSAAIEGEERDQELEELLALHRVADTLARGSR